MSDDYDYDDSYADDYDDDCYADDYDDGIYADCDDGICADEPDNGICADDHDDGICVDDRDRCCRYDQDQYVHEYGSESFPANYDHDGASKYDSAYGSATSSYGRHDDMNAPLEYHVDRTDHGYPGACDYHPDGDHTEASHTYDQAEAGRRSSFSESRPLGDDDGYDDAPSQTREVTENKHTPVSAQGDWYSDGKRSPDISPSPSEMQSGNDVERHDNNHRVGWNGWPYVTTARGTNSQGNRYTNRDYTPHGTQPHAYRYDNRDGSYAYQNPDGSKYYKSPDGYSRYQHANGRTYEKWTDGRKNL